MSSNGTAITSTKLPDFSELEDLLDAHMPKGIFSWENIFLLGRKNLQQLIVLLRRSERIYTAQIGACMAEQDLMRGKSGDDFVREAQRYDNPPRIEMGSYSDQDSGPEPVDAPSRNRKAGTTTYNRCGWCKHARIGGMRYGWTSNPRCLLLQDTEWNEEGRADTLCRLHDMTAEQFEAVVAIRESQVKADKLYRTRVRSMIRTLQEIQRGQIDKPYLPSLRPHSFMVDNRVVLYVGASRDKTCVDGDWAPGVVIVDRHRDNLTVTVSTDLPIWSHKPFDSTDSRINVHRAELLHADDFHFLRNALAEGGDRAFVEVWLVNAFASNEDLDLPAFEQALRDGANVTPK